MTRPRRRPGASVLVTCTDSYHAGEPDYVRYGRHLVGRIGARDGRLTWSGTRPEGRGTVRAPGITMSWPGIAPERLPVKQFRGPDGARMWRFTCTCGLNPEIAEAELAAIIRRHGEGKPGERVVIPLQRLVGR